MLVNSSVKVLDSRTGEPIPNVLVYLRGRIPNQTPVTLGQYKTDSRGIVLVGEIGDDVFAKHGELGAKIQPEHLTWDIYGDGFAPHMEKVAINIAEDPTVVALKVPKSGAPAPSTDYTPHIIVGAIAAVVLYNVFKK